MPNLGVKKQAPEIFTIVDKVLREIGEFKEAARAIESAKAAILAATNELDGEKTKSLLELRLEKSRAIEAVRAAASAHSRLQNADNPNFTTTERTTTDAPAPPIQPNQPS